MNKKRFLSWILTLAMLISLLPTAAIPVAAASSAGSGVDISTAQNLDDSVTEISTGGIYIIGATRTNAVKINTTDTVTLVLNGVTITTATSPIELIDGAKLTLVAKDGTTNILTCNATKLNDTNSGKTAGILVPETASLTIDRAVGENGTGTLRVTGGYGGAGIGESGVVGYTETRNNKGGAGGYWGNGGWTPNNGGQGGRNGIDAPTAGSVTINSGVLAVTGGNGGAGIGGGMGAVGETGTNGGAGTYQYIGGYNYDGHFSSGGGGGGAGGNGGRGGNGGTVTINGGTVNVTGGCFTYERYSKVITVEPAGIGGGSGGIGGVGGLGGANRNAPSGRDAGHGGAGQTGYMNYGGSGGVLTVTGGKVTVTGNKGVGNSENKVGQFCAQYDYNYQLNWYIGTLGVGGGGGGTAIQPTNVQTPTNINITASNDCIDFVDYNGATSFAGRPTDKNNDKLYKVVLTVKNVLNGATVPNAKVAINVNWGNTAMQYTYGSVSRADGTAILWLPKGEYQLAGTAVQADGVGHIPRNQEKKLTVAEDDNNAAEIEIGADLLLSESPDNQKVYDAPVDLKVDAADIDGTITGIRWFRESVSSKNVYSHNPNTQIGEQAFGSGYDTCTDANRGSFSLTGVTNKIYSTSVDQNGKYWVEVKFGTNGSIVRGIEIKNIFKTFDIQFRSEWWENVGQGGTTKKLVMSVPSGDGYGKLLDTQGHEMNQQVGFAWDLDGYKASDIANGTLLKSPYGGFDTVKFYAQSAQLSYNTAALGSYNSFKKDNLVFEKTLNSDFLSNKNEDCDTVSGAKDYSKYTIKYSPKDSDLTLVTIYGRVKDKGVIDTNADPLYTSQRAYSPLITEDNITASKWAGYKLVGVRINGEDAEFIKDAQGNDTNMVALTDIQGTAAKDKIRTVEFIYENNMTDVTIHGYYKGTTEKVFDDRTVSAELGTSFTYPQPVIAGYDNEGADPDGGTIDNVTKGAEITFYYLKSEGNVTYRAEDAEDHTLISSKTVKVKNGAAIDKSEKKAKDVFETIPNYTLSGEGSATADSYNGKDDVTVTYQYTRNKHNLTIVKKDIDSGNEISGEKQVVKNLPAGKLYTFGDTVTAVNGYTAVAALNPVSYTMGDKDEEITFWYRKNDDTRYATVTINSVCDEDGDGKAEVFQSYQIPALKDVALTVSAPEWTGYELKNGEDKEKQITPKGNADKDILTFEYELDNPRYIEVELNNNTDGGKLTPPAGYQSRYTLKKGGSVTIQAPVIDGYALVNGTSTVTIGYNDILDENKVVFNYASVATANFVKHTIKFTNSDETVEFYNYTTLVPKGNGTTTYKKDTVNNVIAGYNLADIRLHVGSNPTDKTSQTSVAAPNNEDALIVYRFQEDTAHIVIKKELSDGKSVKDTVLTGYRTGLNNVVVTAPIVDGYALASSEPLTKKIDKLKSGDNEITFKYVPTDQVTFTLMEHNDETNSDDIIVVRNGEKGKTYDPNAADNPLNLSAAKYSFTPSQSATAPFNEKNGRIDSLDTIQKKDYKVFYTKGTRAVRFIAIDSGKYPQPKDMADFNKAEAEEKGAILAERNLTEKARIGEMYKAFAQSVDYYALDDQISKYYTVEDSSDALNVYFWYRTKNAGTVTVHYHYGSEADHAMNKLLMSYSMDAVVGEKVIIDIPKYLMDGKYKLPADAAETKTVVVGNGTNQVEIYYEANYVNVNVMTKRSDSTEAAEYEFHEVIKTDTQGKPTGKLTLTPPYRDGYTLVGIGGVEGGGESRLPASYQDGKLTLSGLAKDTNITYYYKKTSATQFQSDLKIKYQYNGYELADAKTIKVNRDEANTISIAKFDGYKAKSYKFTDGSVAGSEKDIINGISITPTAETGTLVINYSRTDSSVELPGKDGEIKAPNDKDNIIVTPGDGGQLEGPKDPDQNFEVKDGDATVTRPDPTDPKFSEGDKEEIKVPEGSIIYPDGTIKLPDGTIIKPEDKLPDSMISDSYVIVTYEPNGGSGNVIRQMVKKDEACKALSGDVFTAPRDMRFEQWKNVTEDKTIAAGEEFTPNGDLTFKAQWKEKAQTPASYSAEIVFDSNTGKTAVQTITGTSGKIISGQLKTYADNNFTAPTGWKFMGWSTIKAASRHASFYADGATVRLKEGTTLKLYAVLYKVEDTGTVKLPGADGQPDGGDDVTVTPSEGSDITIGDGYVKAPEGSKINQPAGTIEVIEGTVIVYPDGSVYVPEGSKVKLPDGTEKEGETNIDKDGNVDSDKDKDKPIQKPDGTIVLPGEDGKTGSDDDIIVKPAGPDKPAGRIDEDGNVTITDPDGADATLPGKDPENVKVPEGTVIKPDGEITLTHTVKYSDEKGNQLYETELVQIKLGRTEKIKAVSINGYNLKGEAVKTITGALSTDLKDYIITFTYEKQKSDGGGNVIIIGGGGGSSLNPQKPTIITDGNLKYTLSEDGTSASLTPNDGYEINSIIVNGKEKGGAEAITGLKTGDIVKISAICYLDVIREAQSYKLVARSKQIKRKNGMHPVKVKITWYDENGKELKLDGYEIERSRKRYSGYQLRFKTDREVYYNTYIVDGAKYYYRVRGYIIFKGEKYYTNWSKKAWRTVTM